MKRLLMISLISCFLLSLPLGLWAQHYNNYTEGYVVSNKKTLEIKDSIVILDNEKELIILLFPFNLNNNDIEKVKKYSSNDIAFDKPSPDKSIWERCPFVTIKIRFQDSNYKNMQDIINKDLDDVVWSLISFHRMHKVNSMTGTNYNYENIFDSVVVKNDSGTVYLELSTKREPSSFPDGEEYSWDLKFKKNILISER